jgi:hypothetical protein
MVACYWLLPAAAQEAVDGYEECDREEASGEAVASIAASVTVEAIRAVVGAMEAIGIDERPEDKPDDDGDDDRGDDDGGDD